MTGVLSSFFYSFTKLAVLSTLIKFEMETRQHESQILQVEHWESPQNEMHNVPQTGLYNNNLRAKYGEYLQMRLNLHDHLQNGMDT